MDAIGTIFGLVIAIPVVLMLATVAITVFAIQVAIVVAVGGYIIGIPWSIWFRITKGRWPEA